MQIINITTNPAVAEITAGVGVGVPANSVVNWGVTNAVTLTSGGNTYGPVQAENVTLDYGGVILAANNPSPQKEILFDGLTHGIELGAVLFLFLAVRKAWTIGDRQFND